MYFPDYNALLVPAESISPDYLPSAKRSRPISNLISLIKTRVNDGENDDVSTPALVVPEEAANLTSSQPEPVTPSHQKRPGVQAPTVPDFEKNTVSSQSQPQMTSFKQEAQPNTFGPFAQMFQRPNPPLFPSFQASRPGSGPLSTITNYIQNPPIRLPFANLLNIRFPFQDETPRATPYVHYYTRTPTSESYFLNTFTPRSTVPDPLQVDYTDYLASIQESLLAAQSLTPATSHPESDSSMMVASVPVGKNQATSLVLRPVAKAVAGPKGVAVASPVAKAILRKGEQVDIDFDPDAVAIAGPGGQAHAHPKLIVSYTNDTNLE